MSPNARILAVGLMAGAASLPPFAFTPRKVMRSTEAGLR